ncbi:hypothetical protein [Lentzea sp. NBRC 105346]|nr:hypothetical protein [Lentzea sp. NBRC 105346]
MSRARHRATPPPSQRGLGHRPRVLALVAATALIGAAIVLATRRRT